MRDTESFLANLNQAGVDINRLPGLPWSARGGKIYDSGFRVIADCQSEEIARAIVDVMGTTVDIEDDYIHHETFQEMLDEERHRTEGQKHLVSLREQSLEIIRKKVARIRRLFQNIVILTRSDNVKLEVVADLIYKASVADWDNHEAIERVENLADFLITDANRNRR